MPDQIPEINLKRFLESFRQELWQASDENVVIFLEKWKDSNKNQGNVLMTILDIDNKPGKISYIILEDASVEKTGKFV